MVQRAESIHVKTVSKKKLNLKPQETAFLLNEDQLLLYKKYDKPHRYRKNP